MQRPYLSSVWFIICQFLMALFLFKMCFLQFIHQDLFDMCQVINIRTDMSYKEQKVSLRNRLTFKDHTNIKNLIWVVISLERYWNVLYTRKISKKSLSFFLRRYMLFSFNRGYQATMIFFYKTHVLSVIDNQQTLFVCFKSIIPVVFFIQCIKEDRVWLCGVCSVRNDKIAADIWCNHCNEGLRGACKDHYEITREMIFHDLISIKDFRRLPANIRFLGKQFKKHIRIFQKSVSKTWLSML